MNTDIVEKFDRMGARVKVTAIPAWADQRSRRGIRTRAGSATPVSIDIRRDKTGEYFDLRHRKDVDIQILDVRPADRHLLLMTRDASHTGEQANGRFLCGHDERSWFVAAIPEQAHASNVQKAKDALKPREVWDAIREHGISAKDRDRRRTEAFVRQGEWFFIPRPRLNVDPKLVLRGEPIRRGAGKPHRCQLLYRQGGQQVYVCPKFSNGLTLLQYRGLPPAERQAHKWRIMMRDARVYAKGAIRHADHKTVWLTCWHEVVMNTETQSRAMRNVAFLD